MPRFRDRTTGEILVILITTTVCFGVLASGLIISIVAIVSPEKDTTVWITRVTGIMNTMLGLLAGFLAGRTDVYAQKQPENKQ